MHVVCQDAQYSPRLFPYRFKQRFLSIPYRLLIVIVWLGLERSARICADYDDVLAPGDYSSAFAQAAASAAH